MTQARGWFGPALSIVVAVTLARLVLLAFNRADLFVDESQYWLWGQNLDLGYYSKPPLIGWLIRAVTDLAGNDSPFWVRMPGAVLHAVTALLLALAAERLAGPRAAFWTAVSYATLPFVAVGSLLISTDTVMAPFYALALLAWLRLMDSRTPGWALTAGAAIGAAFLAKYAAIYFLLGVALAAGLTREGRIGWKNALLLLAAFGLVISPNVVWNLTHDLTTVSHTMDNVGWVRSDAPASSLNPAGLAEFFFSQFAVFGPVLFATLLISYVSGWRVGGTERALVLASLPPLLVVSVQALMEKAYANWALAAYFAGCLLVVPSLVRRWPRLLPASVAVNGTIAILLPVLTALAPWPERDGAPLMKRYLGRAELSREIIAVARAEGVGLIYADDRDILADLFYTGEGQGLAFAAPRPTGRPRNYYEQIYPLPQDHGRMLAVIAAAPVCDGGILAPLRAFDLSGGAYAGRTLAAYLVPEGCL
ncbi:glycosyltransferase family 39 protein [Frigidibacter sp. RF13]|uniref:ArnT family glycosyltransferase n=1 Tax=Frigidibacter sp. RF13 TaxID=2997340 RepID=UPI00226F30C7|nr:glycosyltransferase family 39 protein [Frigidibacter sp. RF13]MCY1127855.1 glycosyltransferase family 39 protein [Frigidibacter sp. RF13]